MKRLSFLFMAFALSAFILSSCSEDEDPVSAPLITVTPADDTVKVNVGDIVDYAINWSANPLLSAKISYKAGTLQQIIHDTTFGAGVTTYNYNVQVEIPGVIPVGTVVELTFVGITSDQVSTTVNKYIFVESGMATYNDVVLQAQANGPITAATNLSFYSSTMNQKYTLNQSANADTASYIDIVFTHHSIFKTNAELSFQSPNSANLHQMWAEMPGFNPPYDYVTENKNLTYFKKLDNVDWDNLDYNGINDAVGAIGTAIKIRGIDVGDFIAFETEAGTKGIVKVTTTEIEHNPYNETYITFDVKVQK
ncbi:MAG: hypothetical protein C0591_01735 [Marinilabiliales bacterium]|jgi:hypothetical protein|nr:MAG: hypothetical protein C0591_01735 [Marinilabiliales bacterium]